MLRYFPIVFLGLVLAEIAAFVVIGGRIGALAVVLWVVAAALAGTLLIRHQGNKALARLRGMLEGRWQGEGAAPVQGLLGMLAGVLLIVPGFLSDAAALVLLLPVVRRAIARRLARHVSGAAGPQRPLGQVIEGEAIEIAEPDAPRLPADPPSPWNR